MLQELEKAESSKGSSSWGVFTAELGRLRSSSSGKASTFVILFGDGNISNVKVAVPNPKIFKDISEVFQ